MQGWIHLHRSIVDHWIWQDPVKLKWWLDILLSVNHEDNKVNVGMQLIECNRGQTVMSLKNFSERWLVSRDTVRNFLTLLKNDGMITTENLVKTTRITICNYDNYQSILHDEQTPSKRKPNAKENKILSDEYSFEKIWNIYERKGNRQTSIKKWDKLKEETKKKIFDHVPMYVLSTPDKQFRKNFETYLNQQAWDDEIVKRSAPKPKQIGLVYQQEDFDLSRLK